MTDTETADKPEVIRPPRTIVAAFAVTIAHVVLSIGNSAMLWGFQDYLRRQLFDSNAKLKDTDKHKKDYSLDGGAGLDKLNHDLHSGLNVGLIQILIFSLLIMLLAVNFRKGRGWARWAEILVLVIVVQAPFRLLNLGGDAPFAMKLVSALVGLTGLAIIVLLVLPQSSQYFAAVRGVTAGDRAGGAASMGFRNLFGPRRPAPDADADSPQPSGRTSGRTSGQAVRRPPRPVQTRPAETKPAAKPAQAKSAKTAPEPAAPPPDDAAPERRPVKAKVRAGTDTYADPTAPSPTAGDPAAPTRPRGSVASKSRGKSRRG